MRAPQAARVSWQRAVVVLFGVAMLLGIGNLFWTAHEVHASQAAQQRLAAAQQAAQKREQLAAQQAGQAVEAKLCTTLTKLAALPPPSGRPAANPARAWEQGMHATLAELGPDIGCGRKGH